jgi:hypothetical protein
MLPGMAHLFPAAIRLPAYLPTYLPTYLLQNWHVRSTIPAILVGTVVNSNVLNSLGTVAAFITAHIHAQHKLKHHILVGCVGGWACDGLQVLPTFGMIEESSSVTDKHMSIISLSHDYVIMCMKKRTCMWCNTGHRSYLWRRKCEH